MSAFNITLALPQARGADASSGKAVDPDGGGEANGNRFADMFRDIGREISDAGRSASGSSTGTDAATGAATDAAAADTPLQTLADALASAGKSRTPLSGNGAAERAPGGREPERLDPAPGKTDGNGSAEVVPQRAATGQSLRAGATAHAATRQALAATAARLLSAADAAKAQAAQDQQDLAGAAAATDAATAQISLDDATADKAATERRVEDKTLDANVRRLPGNQGLTALLFGRTEADDTLATTHRPEASAAAGAHGDADAQDVGVEDRGTRNSGAQDAAIPQPALPNTPTVLQLAMPLPPAAAPGGTEPANDEPAQSGAGPLGGTSVAADAAPAAQPMRITILSRETHFAPIRTLALNGASAPAATSTSGPAASAPDFAAAAEGSAAEPTRVAGADPRTAATASGARVLAETAAPAAASLSNSTQPSAGPRTSGEAPADADGEVRITPRTPGRETVRGADARQAGRTKEAEAGTQRSGSAPAKETGTVSREPMGEAAAPIAADEVPLTGLAAIGGSNQPPAPAPALATLRQIGAAIAAEAGTMGATSSVEGPTANLIAGPVRLLDIQLSPDDLGTVNVRMRLINNGLEIRLRASNAETAKMLERDQSALLDLLAASGITADSITIVGGEGAGLAQLTGQDAGRPIATPQPANGEADTPRDQNGRDPQGRNSDDRQKGQSRDDQARSPGRAFDLGGGFRV